MFTKFLGAALLTGAIIGGTMLYLSGSLTAKPVHYSLDGVAVEQSAQPVHAKVVTAPEPGRAS